MGTRLQRRDAIRACLLGGAVGDALGAPVEFDSTDEIRRRFGMSGVREFLPAYGREGAITDDTQMTLFTAEGLIRGKSRWLERGLANRAVVMHRAYLRWLETQDAGISDPYNLGLQPSWLSAIPAVHSRRAPGNTCLAALATGRMGSPEIPLNNSKGCGGVMRAAPAGLTGHGAEWAFEAGCELAAITHGHPTGWLAAGAFAAIVAELLDGRDIGSAVGTALSHLRRHGVASDETRRMLDEALATARTHRAPSLPPALGEGWISEEALGIAVYACLASDTFEDAVSVAVSHGGDSDSTGAIAGNIAGLLFGFPTIPARWLDALELRDVIERIADDFWRIFHAEPPWDGPDLFGKYPPN